MLEYLQISLPILLYVVSITAIVILIVLLLKMLALLKKANSIANDVEKKVKSLDGAFKMIDNATDRISLVIDTITEGIVDFVLAIFSKKNKKGEELNEEGK